MGTYSRPVRTKANRSRGFQSKAFPEEQFGDTRPRNSGVTPNAINSINPNDIERIEVIKGAAATTLYGTEASLLIPDPNRFDGEVRLSGPEGWRAQLPTHAHGDGDHRGLGLADMAEAIARDRPHRAHGDLALHVLDVIETLLEAARSGRSLTLSTTCARPGTNASSSAGLAGTGASGAPTRSMGASR